MCNVNQTFKQFVYGAVMVVVAMAGMLIAAVVITYGEYMMTTTGDIRWGLFYVPHVVVLVWYVRKQVNQN